MLTLTFSLLTDELVVIYVGRKQKKYTVHRDVLCNKSRYFRAAFQKGFKETTENEIYLARDGVTQFDLLIRWIYGAPLLKPENDITSTLRLYFLADKFCMDMLKNEVIDRVLEYYKTNWVRGPLLQMVYENTLPENPLRRCMMTITAWEDNGKRGVSDTILNVIRTSGDVAADYALAVHRYYLTDVPDQLSNCNFHEHNDTDRCTYEGDN